MKDRRRSSRRRSFQLRAETSGDPSHGCAARSLSLSATVETSMFLDSSFPFFILVLVPLMSATLRRLRHHAESPLARRSSFPHLKGTIKRVGFFIAQQEGSFIDFHI